MEQWEYAEFVWDGDGKNDYRAVRFTNPAREWFKPAGNQYLETLRWIGELGFEMVASSFVPLSATESPYSGKRTFSNQQITHFKRRLVEQQAAQPKASSEQQPKTAEDFRRRVLRNMGYEV